MDTHASHRDAPISRDALRAGGHLRRALRPRHALITGGAGFIGSALVDELRSEGGWRVTVVDDFDPLYDPVAKERNLAGAVDDGRVELIRADIADDRTIAMLADDPADVIVHVAAKAGVRQSFADPAGYYRANVTATDAVMRLAGQTDCRQVVVISSSSVYGANPRLPWREDDLDLRPISPYAASKAATEQVAAVYAHRYGLSVPALRLFTVFGPRQRPDLAIHSFARRILAGERITLFGDGSTSRDYTFVADTVRGIRAAMDTRVAGMVPINIGSGRPVRLHSLVLALERALGREARIAWAPEQPGDVPMTHAAIERARDLLGFRPVTPLEAGLESFVDWLCQAEPPVPAISELSVAQHA